MRAVRVLAWGLVCAGCELVFPLHGGGDDGDDAMPIDAAVDAPGPSVDAGSHCQRLSDPDIVLCADFDTPQTGLAGLATPVQMGSLAETATPAAVSLPRVMTATLSQVTMGGGASYAVIQRDLGMQVDTAIHVWVRAEQVVEPTCELVVIDVALGASIGAQVQALANGYRILIRDGAGGLPVAAIVVDPTLWHELELQVKSPMGDVQLIVDGQLMSMINSDSIRTATDQVAYAHVGVAMSWPNGECEFSFDDLAIERFFP